MFVWVHSSGRHQQDESKMSVLLIVINAWCMLVLRHNTPFLKTHETMPTDTHMKHLHVPHMKHWYKGKALDAVNRYCKQRSKEWLIISKMHIVHQ